jgi:hypothetical protein
MQSLKGYKMAGRAITISWAAGKGVKSKEWKDYWDIDLGKVKFWIKKEIYTFSTICTGVSYIPFDKINPTTNFESLEDGGMLDEGRFLFVPNTVQKLLKNVFIYRHNAAMVERSVECFETV